MKNCSERCRLLSLMLVIMLSFFMVAIPGSYEDTLPLAVADIVNRDQSNDNNISYSINTTGNSNPSGQQTSSQATSTPSFVFNDVSSQDGNSLFINYLHSRGLIEGYSDGGFHPQGSLTRAEAATLLVLVAGLSSQESTNSFPDVPPSHWAANNINLAAKAGLIHGYNDGTFRPDQPVSRSEGITMIVNLSRQPDPGTQLPALNDITVKHWAARSIAIGLAAKMVVLSGDQQQFFPDTPFTRGDFSRALSVMLIRNPELAKTALTGELFSLQGVTYLIKAGTGMPLKIIGKATLYPGDSVVTGSDGSAQILFPDGTGLLLQENTTLVIRDGQGRSYMLPDGNASVAVERLQVELKIGRIFGILASRYNNANYNNDAGGAEKSYKPSSTIRTLEYSGSKTAPPRLVYPGSRAPTHKHLYRESSFSGKNEIKLEKLDDVVEFYNQEQAWWQTYTEESERLEVDMPWGTAGIRGTGFGCAVDVDGRSRLSILFGNGCLRANGQKVDIDPGQYSQIMAFLSSPTAPVAMTGEQRQEWLQLRDWLEERAREIQSKMETHLETSLSQERQTINTLLELIDKALNSLAAGSSTPGAASGDSDYGNPSITYSVTYDGNGAMGGSVPVSITDYVYGATVIVLGNSGGLYNNTYTFNGWNTAADGSGTGYMPGDTFIITGDTTLYAVWSPITYTVTYDANGGMGSVPVDPNNYTGGATVTVLDASDDFCMDGYEFYGWNTAADGSGSGYSPGDSFQITGNTTLYAVWAG